MTIHGLKYAQEVSDKLFQYGWLRDALGRFEAAPESLEYGDHLRLFRNLDLNGELYADVKARIVGEVRERLAGMAAELHDLGFDVES